MCNKLALFWAKIMKSVICKGFGAGCLFWHFVNRLFSCVFLYKVIVHFNRKLNGFSILLSIFASVKRAMMKNTIVLCVILLLMLAAFFFLRKYGKVGQAVEEHHDHGDSEGGCCGRHANCEKGHGGEGLYFDDEELDRFKGVSPREYSEDDIEEFRHVLYTMKEDEVDTWVQCLQTRGIELPEDVREEVLMILRK